MLKTTPRTAEVLECRLCLSAPSIASLGLQNDTGETGDNITEDPRLTGTVSSDGIFDYVDIEFDFNGDGMGDDYSYAASNGSFTYNPSGSIEFGEVTIRVRAYDLDEFAIPQYGEWVSITFTYENPNDPPQIASLGLQQDTGEPGDKITENPTITGTVTNDNNFDFVDLEFDFDGDGTGDDFAYANSDGSFTYDPSGHIGFGEVTIRVRAYELDEKALPLYGEWVSITFTYENPNDPPQIASLSLQTDTGVPGDNITENPTITGTVTNDNDFDYVDIEFDFDGDGMGDDFAYANADGSFTFDPSGHIGAGEVTIYVRAYELDENALPLYGEWVPITFTFVADENQNP